MTASRAKQSGEVPERLREDGGEETVEMMTIFDVLHKAVLSTSGLNEAPEHFL